MGRGVATRRGDVKIDTADEAPFDVKFLESARGHQDFWRVAAFFFMVGSRLR